MGVAVAKGRGGLVGVPRSAPGPHPGPPLNLPLGGGGDVLAGEGECLWRTSVLLR